MQILALEESFLLESMRKAEILKDVAKFGWISLNILNVGGEQ